jgi:hypothetical protein
MKPWLKVVLGCFAVAVIGLFLMVAGLIGFGYWAKNKVNEVTAGGQEVEDARKTANAVPFSRPDRGIVSEARLVKFIAIRASVYSVYEKYRGEIENRMEKVKEGKSLDFGDISTGLTLIGELHRAEALALAKQGMSEDEYAFITGELYRSMWMDFGGSEATKKAIRDASQAAKSAADAVKHADANGSLPPEAREAIAQAQAEIAAGTEQATRGLSTPGTAPENVALFKKYEADLRKYAMPGLRGLFNTDEDSKTAPAAKKPAAS